MKKVLSFILTLAIVFAAVPLGAFTARAATVACNEKQTIYWDGTYDSAIDDDGETGTKEDPIIIDSAEELNYIATKSTKNLNGKWCKIADHIGTIVLQPENVIDIDKLKVCADAEAVKAYLANLEGVLSWNQNSSSAIFDGNFNGNGVEICGLYIDNATNAGLFLGVDCWFDTEGDHTSYNSDINCYNYYDINLDEPIMFKNFSIRNSYYKSARNMGAIISTGFIPNYGTRYTGSINIENCVVTKCYLEATNDHPNYQGILLGMVGDHIKINNCLVYDNKALDINGNDLNLYGSLNAFKGTPTGFTNGSYTFSTADAYIENQITNSIILDTVPYGDYADAGDRTCSRDVFENVYTDAAAGTVIFDKTYTDSTTGEVKNYTETYDETDIKNILDFTGVELVSACTGLNWVNTWLATESYPTLRSFHDDVLTVVDNGDGTHTEKCSCGYTTPSLVHIYGNDNICDICNNICNHDGGAEFIEKSAATCTEAAKGDSKCSVCNTVLEENVYNGEPLGHDLQLVDGTSADCENTGLKEYYDCSRCDAVFEDAAGTIPIDNLDEWIVIDAKGHIAKTDENGIVYSVHDGMHYKICSRDGCGAQFDGEAHINGDYISKGENGHIRICSVCSAETVSLNEHTFDENSTCTYCGWICERHTASDAVIENVSNATHLVNGSYQEVVYCSICDFELSRTTKSIIAEGHIYDNVCDAQCNICGDIRVPSDHVYDNSCDTICNVCNASRTITHTYDNACDASCNICGNIRITSDHVYDDIYDTDCNVCGTTRQLTSISISVLPSKIVYAVGEAFDNSGMIVNAYYSDGTSGVITRYTVVDFDSSTAGTKIVNVTYGGRITQFAVTILALEFSGASLTIQNDITINYMVDKTAFDNAGYTNPYVEFEFNGAKTIKRAYSTEDGMYIFSFNNIVPSQINDTVKATLYAEYNGVVYSGKAIEYSVAKYCYTMLSEYAESDNAELKTLLVDLLNYGAAAQIYTDYNTASLANASLTDEQAAWGTETAAELNNVLNAKYEEIESPAVKWKSVGLNLKDSVSIRFKIAAESYDNLTVKITSESGQEWTVLGGNFESAGNGCYYVYFENLSAYQMREKIYVTVYDGDTAVSNTLCYSIESYAYAAQSSSDENLKNLLDAMIKYGDSAYNYKQSIG